MESTPVVLWIPSGLALACVLVKGPWMCIGVLLGSFTFRMGTLHGSLAVVAALAIALSSSLQIFAGERLFRRFIGDTTPQRPREVVLFIAIVAGTATIRPLIGLTALCLTGFQSWSDFLWLAVRWWFGAACGVLFVTPLLTWFWLRFRKIRREEGMLWALGSFLFGTGLLVFVLVGEISRQSSSALFAKDAGERTRVLGTAMGHDIDLLNTFGAFYAASEDVDAQEFETFAKRLLQSGTTMRQIVYAPCVEGDRYLVELSYPREATTLPSGFDLGEDARSASAIAEARDLGAPGVRFFGSVSWAIGAASAALVFVPIYAGGKPVRTAPERRDAFLGCIVGQFDVASWVKASLRVLIPHDIETFLYEEQGRQPDTFLTRVSSLSGGQSYPEEYFLDPHRVLPSSVWREDFEVAGETLSAISLPGRQYNKGTGIWLPWGSLLVSLALTGAFLALMGSKQKREAVMEKSEKEFRALADDALTGVLRVEPSGRVHYANEAAARMFGHSVPLGFLAAGLGDLLEKNRGLASFFSAVDRQGRVKDAEIEVADSGGNVRTLLISGTSIEGVINVTAADVTERIREAKALRQFSRIVDQMADTVVVTDTKGVIEYVNPAFVALTGYSREEAVGSTMGILASGAQPKEFFDHLEATLACGEIYKGDVANKKKDGGLYTETQTISPLRGPDGSIVSYIVTGRDVTERILMEHEIQERMKELTCLFEMNRLFELHESPDGGLFESMVASLRRAMQFPELALPRVELDGQVYGSAAGELGLDRWLSAPIEIKGEARGVVAVAYKEPRPFIIPEEQTLLGNVAHMFGLWLETSESVAALRYSNERFQQLANSVQEAFWIYDFVAKRMEFVGKAYEKIWGWSAESLLNDPRRYAESVLPEDRSILRAIQVRNLVNETTDIEYRIKDARGLVHLIWDRSYPILNAEGKVVKRVGVATDITELKKTQKELEELNCELERRVTERTEEVKRREALYRGLFENSNDAIFLLSSEGKALGANQKALEMIDCTLEELLAMSSAEVAALTPGVSESSSGSRILAVSRGENVPLYEVLFVGKNGTKTQAEVNLSAVRDLEGETITVQAVVRDIAERKRAEERLRKSRDELSAMNAALQKASRMKDEFLASMSHELRTPLTGILGLSEALQLQTFGVLSERQEKAVRNIEESGRHLLALINDILDLSKIEAGRLDLQIEACDATEVCQAALQLVKGMAQQKRQNLGFSIEPTSIRLDADQRRLKQMIVNLLSNAIKFTPEGGSLGLEVVGREKEGVVEFGVWDKGIGIKTENMGELFKPFSQLDSSLSRQYSGTGLGLSLVQKMAELQGGSVKVDSVFGKGSRFTIALPWCLIKRTEDVLTEDGGRTLTDALIVEDNLLDAERLMRQLHGIGIKTYHLQSIDSALEKAAALRPSAILLDINLPDGSGLDLLAGLKADPRTIDIPVVIVSVEERRSEAARLGAIDYLLKPFSFEELRHTLAKISTLKAGDPSLMILQDKHGEMPLVLMADDNELILDMVSSFLESMGYEVIVTKSGPELLEVAAGLVPDIVLVDIQMPGMDGLEVIRRLRSLPGSIYSAVPIVAVTALAMSGDKEACIAAGANDYVSKPFVLVQLERLIRGYVERRSDDGGTR